MRGGHVVHSVWGWGEVESANVGHTGHSVDVVSQGGWVVNSSGVEITGFVVAVVGRGHLLS